MADSIQDQLNYLNQQTGVDNPATAPGPIGTPVDAPNAPPVKVPMVIDGKVQEMDQDAAINAQAVGAHVASPQEIANHQQLGEANKVLNTFGAGRPLYDASVGIVSNYIPGGSLILEKGAEMAGWSPEQASALIKAGQESTAGTLGGIGTLLAPGNLLNKGAHILESAVEKQAANYGLSKVATWAAKQGAAGALYGTHAQLNEDTIENKPLTVESYLHSGGLGAVANIALGIPLKGISAAGSKFLSPTKSTMKAAIGGGVAGDMDATMAEKLGIATQAEKDAADRLGVKPGFEEATRPSKMIPEMPEMIRKPVANMAAGASGESPELIEAAVMRNNGEALQRREIIRAAGADGLQNVSNSMAEAAEKATIAAKKEMEPFSDRAKMFDQPQFTSEFNPNGVQKATQVIQDSMAGMEDKHVDIAMGPLNSGPVKSSFQGFRRMAADLSEEANKAIASGNGGEFAALLDKTRRIMQDHVETLTGLRPANLAEAQGRDILLKEGTKFAVALEAAQRDPNLFGPTLSNGIKALYEPWHQMIQAGKVLREHGVVTYKSVLADIAKQEGLSTYDKFPEFSSGAIKSFLGNLGDKDAQLKIRALGTYLEAAAGTVSAAQQHFNLPITANAHTVFDAHTVMGLLERQAAALHEHRGLSGGTSNSAVNMVESAARAAGYVTAGAVGSALGGVLGGPFGAALGGGIGYMAGPILGAGFNVGKQLNARIAVEQISREWDKRATAAAKTLVGPNAQKAATGATVTSQNYNNIAQKLSAAAANPTQTLKAVTAGFGTAMTNLPTIGTMSAIKATQAIAYLAGALPAKTPTTNALQPRFERERPPSDMALASLNRKIDAVMDPTTVWRNPTREGVDALKHVWPETYNDLRSKTMEAIAKSQTEIPFNVRQRMSILFDFYTDALQDPKRYATIQESFQAPPEKAQPSPKPVDMAGSLLSVSDRIERGHK